MSSIIKKINTICIPWKVLLNDKNMVKNRKKCNKCLDNILGIKIENCLLNVYKETIP